MPDTVNFAFNSSQLDADGQAILRQQADWIRQFPEVRFRVFGHTDLVGSARLQPRAGPAPGRSGGAPTCRRQGISRSRLEAVVSFGKTRPLIQTTAPEVRNRRTVTEVSGFVQEPPDGAERQVCRGDLPRLCRSGATRRIRRTRQSQTQTSPAGNAAN